MLGQFIQEGHFSHPAKFRGLSGGDFPIYPELGCHGEPGIVDKFTRCHACHQQDVFIKWH